MLSTWPDELEQAAQILRRAVAVERIFSGGRDTISLPRTSLHPDTIHTLMLVKHRLRLSRVQVNNGRSSL